MAEAGGGEHFGIEQAGIEAALVAPRRPRHPMGETAAGRTAVEIDVAATPGVGGCVQRLGEQRDLISRVIGPQHPHPPAERAIALGDSLGRMRQLELNCAAVAGEAGGRCHAKLRQILPEPRPSRKAATSISTMPIGKSPPACLEISERIETSASIRSKVASMRSFLV